MFNPFSKDFSSGYSRGGVTKYSDPTAPDWAKYFYKREGSNGLDNSGRSYFETEAEMKSYFDNDQAAYRKKWQFISYAVLAAFGFGLWWHFKKK